MVATPSHSEVSPASGVSARLADCVYRGSRQLPRHALKQRGKKCCMGNGITRHGEYLFEWQESVLDFPLSSSPSYQPLRGILILNPLARFHTIDTLFRLSATFRVFVR